MSNDEKLPLSVGSALERERERMVCLRESKEMTPTKPTIDEQIAAVASEVEVTEKCGMICTMPKSILSTLRAHKAIMEAERPEPVAWATYTNGIFQAAFNRKENADYFVAASKGGPLTQSMPLYGPDLLAYADRMAANAAGWNGNYLAEKDRGDKWMADCKLAERQLAELQAEHDALVKDAERYRWLRENGNNILVRSCSWPESRGTHYLPITIALDAEIDAAMSAVALDKEGE